MTLQEIIAIGLYGVALLTILVLIHEERDPTTTLAWALVLTFVPGLGVLVYLLFGRNWRVIGAKDAVRLRSENLGDEVMAPIYARWSAPAEKAISDRRDFIRDLATAIHRQNKTQPLPCIDLAIFDNGADKFAALEADIRQAKHFVHLEYFIWEHDVLTQRLCELLAERVADGVEVRVLYDWFGSLPYSKAQLKELRRAGAQVERDAAHWTKVNYRNHRKIAVIDGEIAYTGGMNVGQEYIDGNPRYESWRDTHVRFRGPLVADLQRLFAQRWYRLTEEKLFDASYVRALGLEGQEPIWSQLSMSGPESELAAIRNVYMISIMAAHDRVRIQSPYFIPDAPTEQALITQALSGVNVEFMMTGVPDKKIVYNAAFSYIDDFAAAGGRMLHYGAGYLHAKTMTVDGEMAIIGTTNFDVRSFLLHDELCVCFYDRGVAARLDVIFDADLQHCRDIDLTALDEQSRWGVFGNALARLWSALL